MIAAAGLRVLPSREVEISGTLVAREDIEGPIGRADVDADEGIDADAAVILDEVLDDVFVVDGSESKDDRARRG
jgi:hypothetical protein